MLCRENLTIVFSLERPSNFFKLLLSSVPANTYKTPVAFVFNCTSLHICLCMIAGKCLSFTQKHPKVTLSSSQAQFRSILLILSPSPHSVSLNHLLKLDSWLNKVGGVLLSHTAQNEVSRFLEKARPNVSRALCNCLCRDITVSSPSFHFGATNDLLHFHFFYFSLYVYCSFH